MADVKLHADARAGVGKNKVDKIRAEANTPGILYRKGEENLPVKFASGAFEKVFKEAGTSTIIDVIIEGQTYPSIIKDVQRHPFKNLFLHVDFQTIRMDEKLKLSVPITLEGRDEIRLQPSVLNQLLNELEIECLPGDIPDEISYNVSDMDFETPVHVKDLEIFGNEAITIHHEPDTLIAILTEPHEAAAEEEEGEEIDAADVPTVGETEGSKDEE